MEKRKLSSEGYIKSRLDDLLTGGLAITRSQAKKLITEKRVSINGICATKAGIILREADEIEVEEEVTIPPKQMDFPKPEAVFENSEVVIIKKPAGIVTHLDAKHVSDALSERVRAHFPLASIGMPNRPGVVHRLDKDTSGLIIFAKTDAAYYQLIKLFAERRLQKDYLTLLHGGMKLPDSGTIEAPIARHLSNREKMDVSSSTSAKPAISHFTVLERFATTTLVRVRIETGRTHQIRVHFSAIGYPVIGDKLYGNPWLDSELEKVLGIKLPRLFLHAERLAFVVPGESTEREFIAELPEDLKKIRAAFG